VLVRAGSCPPRSPLYPATVFVRVPMTDMGRYLTDVSYPSNPNHRHKRGTVRDEICDAVELPRTCHHQRIGFSPRLCSEEEQRALSSSSSSPAPSRSQQGLAGLNGLSYRGRLRGEAQMWAIGRTAFHRTLKSNEVKHSRDYIHIHRHPSFPCVLERNCGTHAYYFAPRLETLKYCI